jgi:hypothetical protein
VKSGTEHSDTKVTGKDSQSEKRISQAAMAGLVIIFEHSEKLRIKSPQKTNFITVNIVLSA